MRQDRRPAGDGAGSGGVGSDSPGMPGFGSSGVGIGPGDGLGSGGIGSVSDGLGFGGSSIDAVGLWVRIGLLRRGTLVVAEDGGAQTGGRGVAMRAVG